jgi:hypothetical protein
MRRRSLARASVLAFTLLLVSLVAVPAFAQASAGAAAAPASASELDGQINGIKARFVAQADDVLISSTEADRIGLAYRDGKRLSIGGTPLWLVTLGSVTVAGRTRLAVTAGVVPSIDGYRAALQAHPAEAFARSREIEAEVNGTAVKAYDLGDAGVLVTPAEAERAGLNYREGKREDVGATNVWRVEALVKMGADKATPTAVTVTEPEAYFEALMSGAGKPR